MTKRILAYQLAQELNKDELEQVSGAATNGTSFTNNTGYPTGPGTWDLKLDTTLDL